MKLKPLMLSSSKITILFLSFSTLSGLRIGGLRINERSHDVKKKSSEKITNKSSTGHHGHMGIKFDITFFAGFKKSSPKPWRKDDKEYIQWNQIAEIPVDPVKPVKLPIPPVNTRTSASPALNLISPEKCGTSDIPNTRVVNGKDAQLGAYPWMAAILKNGEAYCGGSIINDRWILTAGHCFIADQDPRFFAIRVGTVDRNQGTTYKADKVIIHERFHTDNMFNSDIALVHVKKPIVMGELVRPVCISKKPYEESKAAKLLVMGWGRTSFENKDLPNILQEVLLSVIKIQECAKKYKARQNKIYFSQMCTWQKGQDACQGDSGSPAIEYIDDKAYQVGIVSYGTTCADKMPGVYTKLSYYLDWIIRTLEKEEGLTKVTTAASPEKTENEEED